MKVKVLLLWILVCGLLPMIGNACTMYKITEDSRTVVGNNEDWFSPNSKFWFEQGSEEQYGVMYMGLLDNFAQGAINEAGLVFDGFANPHLPITQTANKLDISIGTAIRNIMQTMRHVDEVKAYLATINLSGLESSQIVFVDNTGSYLIVEGDELIIGLEAEKSFSNFYYSEISSLDEVKQETFCNGQKFLNQTNETSTRDYCGAVMQSYASAEVFGTQYSTIYDLSTMTVRVYLFHDYSEFVEIDLLNELEKENYEVMIADLFPKSSIGSLHYQKYNNENHPTEYLEELIHSEGNASEVELAKLDYNDIFNAIGYEWMEDMKNPAAAIKVFQYGISVLPNDADLYDSLGEAYFENKEYNLAQLNYKKSLAMHSDNDNAKAFLTKIEKIQSGG